MARSAALVRRYREYRRRWRVIVIRCWEPGCEAVARCRAGFVDDELELLGWGARVDPYGVFVGWLCPVCAKSF